jgi:Holliday junction resolvase RusA-like endonuclease
MYEDIISMEHLVGREIVLDVTPCPKPRMTQRDKWKKRPCVLRYHAFKDALRSAWPEGVTFPGDVVIALFQVPMPASWSKAKRDEHRGKRHEQRPDADNYSKALLDAAMVEDKSISTLFVEKRWADKGAIRIVVYD